MIKSNCPEFNSLSDYLVELISKDFIQKGRPLTHYRIKKLLDLFKRLYTNPNYQSINTLLDLYYKTDDVK